MYSVCIAEKVWRAFFQIIFHVHGKAGKHMAIFCFAVGMYGHTANWLFCRVPYMCHVFSSPAHGKLSILLYARCVSCACRQADDKVLICGVCCICRVLDNLQTTNDQAHDKCSFSGSDEMGSYILFANLTS